MIRHRATAPERRSKTASHSRSDRGRFLREVFAYGPSRAPPLNTNSAHCSSPVRPDWSTRQPSSEQKVLSFRREIASKNSSVEWHETDSTHPPNRDLRSCCLGPGCYDSELQRAREERAGAIADSRAAGVTNRPGSSALATGWKR